MERKVIKEENVGGVHTIVETVEQTREDGVVPKRAIHEMGDRRGKYHYGESNHVKITTNNPNITRPFVYSFCALFFIIGIVLLFMLDYIMGIFVIGFVTYCFFHFKKEIDEVEEEIRKQGGSVIKEDAREDLKEFGELVKEGFEDSCKATFTKENFKWFSKTCMVAMSIIAPIISLIFGLIFGIMSGLIGGIIIGILVLAVCIFITILYLLICSKIFKH